MLYLGHRLSFVFNAQKNFQFFKKGSVIPNIECRNFVVPAPVAKDQLCDLMLFKGGATGRPGSVDSKSSVSDFMPDEQERHSSIYSSVMNCLWKEHHFFFIDTPGYAEFAGEVASAMRQADAALVVIDDTDGKQVGTARDWKLKTAPDSPLRFRQSPQGTLRFQKHLGKSQEHGRNVIIRCITRRQGDSFKARGLCCSIWRSPRKIDEVPPQPLLSPGRPRRLMPATMRGKITDAENPKGMVRLCTDLCNIPVFAGSSSRTSIT